MARQVVRDFGTCLVFNGSSDKVQTALWSSAINTISMGAWFKSKNYKQNRQPIISNGDGSVAGAGYALVLSGNATTDGSLMLLNHNTAWIDLGAKVQDDKWHHIMLTIDASDNTIVYLDGVVIFSAGAQTLGNPRTNSYIGTDNSGSGFFYGSIDEVRFYTRALSATEVPNLFYGIEPASTSFANWYKFDEGSGTSATDSKGSSTGTITNATYSTDVFMKTRSAAATRLPLSLLTNLVSYWKFDENTGTLVADSVGTNTGTWNGSGSHWTSSGKINAAGVFDGSTDYVNVPNASSLNFTTAVSVSAWVYMTTVNINNQILSKRSAFSGNGIPYELTSTGNPNKFFSWRVIGSGKVLTSTKTVIQANTWYHVVGTWDGTNQIIYLNGEVEASATATGTITANSTPIAIGQLPSGGGEGLTGRIDEVGLWSRGLKEFEVKALYNAGNGNQYGFSTATRAAA